MRFPLTEHQMAGAACTAPVFSLRNRIWSYRGEGNANLVLAIPDERAIVRLRKCLQSEAADAARILREVDFCRAFMRPLLGESVHVPAVVRISPWELDCLNEQLTSLRPQHRHHKSVFGELAAVFPDLCFLPERARSHAPTFCVEVKAKQGWIAPPDRRLPKCTYCLNQYLKLTNGSIAEASEYCPLNLFSGDSQLMKSALLALVRCPQNNFKIFCNGTLQYGESSGPCWPVLESWFGKVDKEALLDNMCHVVLQALTSTTGSADWPTVATGESVPQQSRIPQKLLEQAASLLDGPSCFRPPSCLPPGCILDRILRIQKLDVLGSDEVHRLYSAAPHDDYSYVSSLLQSPRDVLHPLYSYLLATTAKDCSILIAFQKATHLDDCANVVQDVNGTRYVFSIGVSDLDPKPMSCIEKHRKRDVDVVQSCIEWCEAQRVINEAV